MPPLSRAADFSAKWAAVAIGFAVPISVALDNALMLAVLAFWLLSSRFSEKAAVIRRNPVALAALALFGILFAGMFYGKTHFLDALGTLGKYIDLLFVPVFLTLFEDPKARKHALNAFVVSMLLTLFLSYMLKIGIVHGSTVMNGMVVREGEIVRGFAENPYVFKLHITQNFFMSFCALILAVRTFQEKTRGMRILWGTLALLALIDVLFMVQGRIGYIVLALLLLYLFVEKLGRKGLFAGIVAAMLLGSLAYFGSGEFHKRISVAMTEFTQWHRNDATKESDSIGQRLEFYTNTLEIVKKHPLFGVGTGGFPGAYAEQVAGTNMIPTHNPHNEFLLITAQTGLPGLFLLFTLFYLQWREGGKFRAEDRYLARGLVLAMASGCLFNSFLLDHAEGLFFSWMTAVLFSGRAQD